MTKAEWQTLAWERRKWLQDIAKALGKEHPVTKMMGSLAWGRHNWESGPTPTLQSAIQEAAAVGGVFYILNLWARDNNMEAQRRMLDIWGQYRKP